MSASLQTDGLFKNQRRNALALHPTQTGIDYIEVEQVAEGQWDLHLSFIPAMDRESAKIVIPATLTPANVRITGGKGKKKSDLKVINLSRPERDRSKIIISVRKDAEGDFPLYTLFLVKAEKLDPFFSQISFILDLDEPSQYDLQPTLEEVETTVAAPQIDYLSRDYGSFRSLMLDRLSEVSPEWKERNPADLMMTMVEALAYSADQLSYYQDAVATEAYLGTARKRTSVRRHARLVDYAMHEGCNARTWAQVEVMSEGSVQLERGTRFFTRVLGKPTNLPNDEATLRDMLSKGTQVFESMHFAEFYPEHNEIPLYDWGSDEFVLPEGCTEATLQGHYLNLKKGDVLIFEEMRGPLTGVVTDADPKYRWAVRLTAVTPSKDPLAMPVDTGGLITQVTWSEEDALPFTLQVVTLVNGNRTSGITLGRANTVLLDHGRSVTQEELLPTTVPEQGNYRPRLNMNNLTFATRYEDPLARQQPLVQTLDQDPRSAIPRVRVEGSGEVWTALGDLMNSDRSAHEFVVEMENDRSATLRFGNGTHGKRPIAGNNFTTDYRIGNGALGNIGADSIAHIADGGTGIRSVRNPLPGKGGTEPESLDQVRFYAPQAYERQERAVTAEDYAFCAEKHPEVERASAYIGWTGSWSTVRVTVQRKNGLPVNEQFKVRLISFLENYRLIGYEVTIESPSFIPLDISLVIHPKAGAFPSAINSRLLELFSDRELAKGSDGFFHPNHFSFGTPVYLSNIIATVMKVPGVDWIDLNDSNTRFQRWGKPETGELDEGIIQPLPLEIVKLNNDPDHPEMGVLKFIIKGAA